MTIPHSSNKSNELKEALELEMEKTRLMEETIKKIEAVLKNKQSANYVKSLAQNTVPREDRLYQRFITFEDPVGRKNAKSALQRHSKM